MQENQRIKRGTVKQYIPPYKDPLPRVESSHSDYPWVNKAQKLSKCYGISELQSSQYIQGNMSLTSSYENTSMFHQNSKQRNRDFQQPVIDRRSNSRPLVREQHNVILDRKNRRQDYQCNRRTNYDERQTRMSRVDSNTRKSYKQKDSPDKKNRNNEYNYQQSSQINNYLAKSDFFERDNKLLNQRKNVHSVQRSRSKQYQHKHRPNGETFQNEYGDMYSVKEKVPKRSRKRENSYNSNIDVDNRNNAYRGGRDRMVNTPPMRYNSENSITFGENSEHKKNFTSFSFQAPKNTGVKNRLSNSKNNIIQNRPNYENNLRKSTSKMKQNDIKKNFNIPSKINPTFQTNQLNQEQNYFNKNRINLNEQGQQNNQEFSYRGFKIKPQKLSHINGSREADSKLSSFHKNNESLKNRKKKNGSSTI